MISESRFLSGGYSTFITTSNQWNIWADDDSVFQICSVCEASFCSWHRFRHDAIVSGRKNGYLLPPFLSPSPSVSLPTTSLLLPPFSLLESNKKKDLSVFWASFLFLEMLVLETMRRKLMHHLPVFHSPHAFTGWWWGWVGEIASLAIAHSPAEERGCAVVVAMVEELVWMIRERKPKTSFLFSPGATCPVGYSGAASFLDLNWLFPR